MTFSSFQKTDLAIVSSSEILILGTGRFFSQVPPNVREYLHGLGVQIDMMGTVSARFRFTFSVFCALPCSEQTLTTSLLLFRVFEKRKTPARPSTCLSRKAAG